MQEDTQANPVQQNMTAASTLFKDLLIPISIVIAGAMVGFGMYFSGGAVAPVAGGVAVAQPEVQDTTGKYNPITPDEHIRGSLNAPIKIVEYSDYDCPFCSRFHETMKVISEKYGDQVVWVFRQFPLESLHPNAPAVAMASECVAELGGNDAYWNFTDAYFTERAADASAPHATLIPQLAAAAGVNAAAFNECFESGRHEDAILADSNNAVETGGGGTPWSILIGPSGKTYPVNGALPQQSIEQLINIALEEA